MPIQAPNEKPAIQQRARLGIDRLRPVERGGGVGQFAGAVVERALAASHAAEVEADGGKAAVHEGVVELVDDLWFIVPPNCGCGCSTMAIGAFFFGAGW